MARCLVTGGAGFIGSHLVERLLELGHEVKILDDLSTGARENLERVARHPNCELHVGSITDPVVLAAVMPGIDVVYHLAAAVGVKLVADDPVRTIETNIYPTELLLRLAVQGKQRVFLASTSEVYGKNPKDRWTEEDDLFLGPTSRPRWAYGCSKAIDEFLALAYHRKHALDVVVGRFFNVVGPRQVGHYGMVIPRFVDQALDGGPVVVYDDGGQVRCFAHVREVVECVVRLMVTPAAVGRVFNIGSDEAVSVRKLAEEIISRVDPRVKIDYLPYSRAYGEDFEDVRRRVPDVSRLYETIGMKPRISLGAILDDIIRWKRGLRKARDKGQGVREEPRDAPFAASGSGVATLPSAAVGPFDDARLKQLAAWRPKDLFPILDRSKSLMPLLVVLTFLPGIVALESASIDELDAQWRLKSLELSTASSVFDVIDPSGISETDLKWQPPLGSWVAAGAVHLPGPLGAHGLELVDYLSAASLVPASFFLAYRLFGRRIGFITALLVALHTTFLEQHQNATPHGLAILTALGAFWGFFGHLRHRDDLVSLDLLVGGISLGLCLLAGGPLAFVVVAALLMLVLANFEPAAESRRAVTARREHLWSGWPAFRSLGVLVATAFAAGGWWELMMLYSYGGEFLTGWLWGMPASPGASRAVVPFFSHAYALRFAREFFAMARVLAGLTLLGLWTIGRGLFWKSGCKRRASFLFLGAWCAWALLFFAAGLRDAPPGSLYLNMWRLFLMSACTACSALALDEVARRRIGLPLFATVTLGALVVGSWFLHHNHSGATPPLWILGGGLFAAAVAAQVLRRLCQTSETRQWLVLSGLIAAYVVADASIGISTIRADDADWRALTTFHSSLPPRNGVETCLVISESAAPNRLLLALKSVWPTTVVTLVRDWDQALKMALDEHQMPMTVIVVDWSHGNSRPANPTGAQWETVPVGNPQFFQHRQLRAYLVRQRQPPPETKEDGGPTHEDG